MARAILWLIAACCVSLPGVSSGAERLFARGSRVADSYFGIHMHYAMRPNDRGRITPWPDVGFGAWRLVDAYVQWRDLEPRRGQWDFKLLDRYAELATRHGVSLLYTFGHPAKWASARPAEPSYTYGEGVAAEPADMADWEIYVRTVVSRYRGRIQAYEIWNEPWFREIESVVNKQGMAAYYSGTAAKMIELARVVYRVVKEIDPAATVLTPAFDHAESGAKRLDLYLTLGGAAVSDAVAFHFYTPSPESMLPVIAQVQAVMRKHGIGDRELWNTETGYATKNSDEPGVAAAGKALGEQEAAAYVMRALVLAAAAGVKRFYWYAWDNGIFGLTHGRGRAPHTAAKAYSQIRRWLSGATVANCQSAQGGQWVCTLTRTGRTAWIAWRTQGQADWIPPARALEVVSLGGGHAEAAAGGRISIDATPILIKADRLPWGS